MSAVSSVRRGLARVTTALGLRAAIGQGVGRVFAAAHVPPPGLRAGRLPTPAPADELPVVVVVLLGAQPEAVAATVEVLADVVAGRRPGVPAVRPLLLLDRPHFAPARQAGLPFDHVVPEQDWPAHGGRGPWQDHVGARLALLCRQYATSTVLRVPPGGIAELGEEALREGLRVPPLSAPSRWRRRVVGWAERKLDAPARG
ncbi:MAG: hypothetical protein U0Q15_14140 [Kineosporiaceae bacterium]